MHGVCFLLAVRHALGEIGVAEGLHRCDSFLRDFFEHPGEEVQSLRIKGLVLLALEGDITGSVLSQDFIVGLAREGTDSQEEDVEDESQAEDITDGVIFSLHILDVDDLRGHIPGSTAPYEEILHGIRKLSEPEVSNDALEAALCLEEDVFGLEIAMHDLLVVHLLEATEDGVDGRLDLQWLELVLGFHLIVQLSALQQLHHDVKGVLRLEDFKELHAVAMAEPTHHFDLLDEALLALVLTVGRFLREGLDGVVAVVLQFLSEVDGGEVALPDFLLGLELLVEAALVDLGLEDLAPLLQVSCRPQGVSGALLALFEGDGGRGGGEGELDVEVEDQVCLGPGGGLHEAAFIEGNGDVAFVLAGGLAGEEQLAAGVGGVVGEEGF